MRSLGLLLALAFIVAVSSVYSQDKPQSAPPDMQEMMKKWKEVASPNEHHKALDAMVGKWDMSTAVWMGGPGAEPSVTKGAADIDWMIDGRFLRQDAKGEFMGLPYTGFGLTGYDNMKKCYTMVWIDNTSTAFSAAEGNFDQSGKNLILYGKMDEPTTGEHDKNVKYVIRFVDKDKVLFEVHDLAIGENNTKVMEITYTRAK